MRHGPLLLILAALLAISPPADAAQAAPGDGSPASQPLDETEAAGEDDDGMAMAGDAAPPAEGGESGDAAGDPPHDEPLPPPASGAALPGAPSQPGEAVTQPLSPLAPSADGARPGAADAAAVPTPRRTRPAAAGAAPMTGGAPETAAMPGIPGLANLRQTRERPLFVPDRRGVRPVAPPPAPVAEPAPAPVEDLPPPLTLVLSGIAAGPGVEMAILVDPADHGVRRMRAGEEHDGWRLERVDRITATFRRGDEETVLSLKPPGVTATGVDAPRPPTPTRPRPPVASGEGQ